MPTDSHLIYMQLRIMYYSLRSWTQIQEISKREHISIQEVSQNSCITLSCTVSLYCYTLQQSSLPKNRSCKHYAPAISPLLIVSNVPCHSHINPELVITVHESLQDQDKRHQPSSTTEFPTNATIQSPKKKRVSNYSRTSFNPLRYLENGRANLPCSSLWLGT